MKAVAWLRGTRRALQTIAACAVGVATLTTEAGALEPVFTLGCVSVAAGHDVRMRELLDSAIREELKAPAFAKLRSRKQYVLSARLVRLQSARKQASARATCDVSIVLRTRPSDSLFAVVKGRATAEDAAAHTSDVQLSAVRGAVHAAMRRVPGALAQVQR
jgi:hypothetical protein